MPADHPFKLLQQIAQAAQKHAAPLPQSQDIQRPWDGILYRFGDFELLSPLHEISEIVPCPELALIPGAKPWVRGVANVRGNLITVIELGGFLGQRLNPISNKSRILVINQGDLMAGLLVDEVYGLRHFDYDQQQPQVVVPDPALIPYIQGGFDNDQGSHLVLSLFALTQSTEFLNIAA